LYNSNRTAQPQDRQVLARLSIIVAPNKKGDIIVREGQDDHASLRHLVENFIVCYGLKKEMFNIIFPSLINLIDSNKMEALTLHNTIPEVSEEKEQTRNVQDLRDHISANTRDNSSPDRFFNDLDDLPYSTGKETTHPSLLLNQIPEEDSAEPSER
jgi:hypothetical protein